MEADPDYSYDLVQEGYNNDKAPLQEADARQAVAEKIRTIIKKHFAQGITEKEREIQLITHRLSETRQLLDRLRACAVASYYASSFAKPLEKKKGPELGAAQHPAIQNVLRKAVTSVLSKNVTVQKEHHPSTAPVLTEKQELQSDVAENDKKKLVSSEVLNTVNSPSSIEDTHKESGFTQQSLGGRHRIKKTVIVGNVSKYIPPDKREGNDKSTHKWMVYVRGGKEEARIDHFVRKVWFFLHPSYRPNDLVEVTEAPFHLTRRGWGEFPIRIQLHFCDPRNRRVDIIHNLRLDRTYTGLQTLGGETICEVELDRATVGLVVDNFLSQPVYSNDNIKKEHTVEDAKGPALNDAIEEMCQNPLEQKDPILPENSKSQEQPMAKRTEADKVSPNGKIDNGAEEPNQKGLVCSDKKKRRRRGDSSCVMETEEATRNLQAKKSLVFRLLGSDKSTEKENVELKAQDTQEVSKDSKEGTSDCVTETNTVEKPPSKICTKPIIFRTPEKGITGQLESPKKINHSANVTPKATTVPSSPVNSKTCVILTTSPKPLSSKGQTAQNIATVMSPRQRSVSADSVTSIDRTGTNLMGKVLLLQKHEGELKKTQVSSNLGKQLVVLRNRSQSSLTEETATRAQVDPSGYTLLKRIALPAGQPLQIAQRKRQAETDSVPGTYLLSVVPEKQRKIDASDVKKQVHILSKPTLPDAKIPLTSKTSGTSGSVVIPHKTCAFPASSSFKQDLDQQQKSFVLKSTKQGLVLVSDKNAMKTSATTSSKSKGKGDAVKGLSQQQLVSLKALQTALLGAGVSINRPVQVKVEKPAAASPTVQQGKPLPKTPQFVLTTVTTDQGDQQIALISAEHLKRKVQKPTVKDHQMPKQEHTEIPIHSHHVKPKENLPFYKEVGNKIRKNTLHELVGDALPLAATYIPLVERDRHVVNLPFAAQSEAEFLEWNVGKQHAAEWQRASLIRKTLAYIKDTNEAFASAKLPSKRFIVNWCLKRGYSVFTDEFEDSEGVKPMEISSVAPSTLSLPDEVVDICETSPSVCLRGGEADIDIVSVTPPKVKTELTDLNGISPADSVYQVNPTPEIVAVEELAQQVEVRLPFLPIAQDLNAPLSQIVLAKALEMFCQQLCKESLASSLERRDGPSRAQRILPSAVDVQDVSHALVNHKQLSMLTNTSIGSL